MKINKGMNGKLVGKYRCNNIESVTRFKEKLGMD
jgi:hypothetical protein